MRTNESAHVFDDTKNRDFCFAAEVDLFSDVKKGNFLRGCHDESSSKIRSFEVLDNGEMLVRSSRRSVDN